MYFSRGEISPGTVEARFETNTSVHWWLGCKDLASAIGSRWIVKAQVFQAYRCAWIIFCVRQLFRGGRHVWRRLILRGPIASPNFLIFPEVLNLHCWKSWKTVISWRVDAQVDAIDEVGTLRAAAEPLRNQHAVCIMCVPVSRQIIGAGKPEIRAIPVLNTFQRLNLGTGLWPFLEKTKHPVWSCSIVQPQLICICCPLGDISCALVCWNSNRQSGSWREVVWFILALPKFQNRGNRSKDSLRYTGHIFRNKHVLTWCQGQRLKWEIEIRSLQELCGFPIGIWRLRRWQWIGIE